MNNSIIYANAKQLFAPQGHYSHYTIANGFVFISGQLPTDRHGHIQANTSFSEQALQTLANIEACLTASGVGKQNLVQVRVYISDINQWQCFNEIYANWIGNYRPARAIISLSELHYSAQIEIEAMALAKNETIN